MVAGESGGGGEQETKYDAKGIESEVVPAQEACSLQSDKKNSEGSNSLESEKKMVSR